MKNRIYSFCSTRKIK